MEYPRLPSTEPRAILTGGRISPRRETDSERLRDGAKDTQPGAVSESEGCMGYYESSRMGTLLLPLHLLGSELRGLEHQERRTPRARAHSQAGEATQ